MDCQQNTKNQLSVGKNVLKRQREIENEPSVGKNSAKCQRIDIHKQIDMKKNSGNTLIKVLSLGIGLAIGMVLIAKVCFELSYDRFYGDAEQIFQIRTSMDRQGNMHDMHNISGAVAPGFQNEVPGVLEATRYSIPLNGNRYIDSEKNIIEAESSAIAADTNFFKIFKREFLIGDPVESLSSWNQKVVVSRSFAEKLGGVNECIGKSIVHEELPHVPFNIAGVFEDFPANSTIQADVVTAIHVFGERSIDNWLWNDRYAGYVRLAEGVDPESLTDAIHKMQLAHQPLEQLEKDGLKLRYYLSPFESMHQNNQDVRNQVITLSVIAFLLILISLLNYVLVAVSDVIRRSREMGVRKCYGADSESIYGLLIKETLINVGISLAVAIGIIWTFRPVIEVLTDVSVRDMMIPQTFLVLGLTLLLIFTVSVLIPAGMFVKIPISSAFRGYKESKRRWKLSLLTFQFAINSFLLILVSVAWSQYHKVTNEDVGYNPENLAYVSFVGLDNGTVNSVMDELKRLPFVEGVGCSDGLPFNYASGNDIFLPGDDRTLFNVSDQYWATVGFMELMQFRMLEGRSPKETNEIAVSKSFVDNMMRFQDWSDGAVGKAVRVSEHSRSDEDIFIISGVFEDYRIGAAERPDKRPIIRFAGMPMYMPHMVVRLTELNPENLEALNSAASRIIPDKVMEFRSYEEDMKSMYDDTLKMKNTFMIGSIIALLIALFGLIGFISDETVRRSAEIAIRKVNGAQTQEVVSMFVFDIMKLAAIAIAIGNIAAWFVARKWLEQFAERVALGPWYFILADIALLTVITATVVIGSIKVARLNPTVSLKKE